MLSSSESFSSKESQENSCAPKQTSLMASLVSYSSDTGSDNESSVSKTVSQDLISNSNHNSVCEKPNSKESYELLVESSCSASDNLSSSLSPQNFRSNKHKEEFVLKSGENEENESTVSLIESPRNKIGNVLKILATPTSVNKSELLKKTSSTPLRSFSVTENECIEDAASYMPRKSFKRKLEDRDNWESSHRYQASRKSLPAVIQPEAYTSSSEILNNRRSFPFSKSSYHSPTSNRNFYSYRTDQTPFSPIPKRRRFNLPYYDASPLMSLESEYGFIDSHCHLDFLFQRQNYKGTYAEYQEEHRSTFPKSYQGCLAIFCNPFTFSQKAIWSKFLEENNVWASFGCHPHNAKDYNDTVEKSLYAALEHSKVRALGEIGLDYSHRNSCMKAIQFEVFRRQLKIVLEKQLPVVIHCREANEDAIRIIKEILPIDYTIHLHCFTDTWEWAQKWLDEFPNLCIGITNVVTFPSADSVHEVAKNIPLDRLLLETDAPYFIPKRGCKGMRWSHPGLAIHVAAQIAVLKNIPIEKVFQATRNNTKRIYNI